MQNLNHSKLLGILAGEGGEYFIDSTPINENHGLKFARIKITATAEISELKIRGTSVVAAQNLGSNLPVGLELFAGGDDYFDAITLVSGSAVGYLISREADVVISGIIIPEGGVTPAVIAGLNVLNNGNPASKKVIWRLLDEADEVVKSGEVILYFLVGSKSASFYISDVSVGENYKYSMRFEESEVWVTSNPFDIVQGD